MANLNRRCFVPGCSVGYDKTRLINKEKGLRNKSLFKAKDEAQAQEWQNAISRADRMFTKQDVVCELHFSPECIERYFETRLPDGVIFRIEREKKTLKPGAVPTIFNYLQASSTKYLGRKRFTHDKIVPVLPSEPARSTLKKKPKRRKKPLKTVDDNCKAVNGYNKDSNRLGREIVTGKETKLTEEVIDRTAEVCERSEVIEDSCLISDCVNETGLFDIITLMENIKHIKLPSQHWSVIQMRRSVVFLCLGYNFLTEKTLVVSEEMTLKVIFKRKEVFIDGIKAIKDMDHLTKVVGFLDVLELTDIPSDDES